MKKIGFLFTLAVFLIFSTPVSWTQDARNISGSGDTSLEQEIDQLKKTITDLEKRLEARENSAKSEDDADAESVADIEARIDELEERADEAEMQQALDRVRFSGDYRFEAHGIWANVPAHFDGMARQNLVVKTMFAMPFLGRPPMSVDEINNTVSSNYADYLQFSGNLTFNQLKQGMGSIPPEMQQQLFGLLMPSTHDAELSRQQ